MPLLTIPELAKATNISQYTLRRNLHTYQGVYRFSPRGCIRVNLQEFLDGQKQEVQTSPKPRRRGRLKDDILSGNI